MSTIKSFGSRNGISIVISILIIFISIAFYCINKPIFISSEVEVDKESLYNLLTVNTIFAGFIYSMLGNMVEFLGREDIEELDKAGYIDPYFSPMYFGLFYFIVSIFIELSLVFFGITKYLNELMYIQQIGTMLGLIFFGMSTLKMRRMINKIRNRL